MTEWKNDELAKIVAADDLHISPFRDDGVTYGTPTWIWSVVVGGELYVRPYHGRNSRWYQAALRQKAGRITVAGITKEVSFDHVDGPVNDRIDDAYRAKYNGSPYLPPIDRRKTELGDCQDSSPRNKRNQTMSSNPPRSAVTLPTFALFRPRLQSTRRRPSPTTSGDGRDYRPATAASSP